MEAGFEGFRKIPRLSREMIITEKLDGTNAQVFIEHVYSLDLDLTHLQIGSHYSQKEIGRPGTLMMRDGCIFIVSAGSRKRWISLQEDNHGFAAWVHENAQELCIGLGPGRHFGEWWGSGINRGYGLENGEKRFSLFNRGRWNEENKPSCCEVVPILYQSTFDTHTINFVLSVLKEEGSIAAPGFMRPEGIIIYHSAANMYFKKTLEDDTAKGTQP